MMNLTHARAVIRPGPWGLLTLPAYVYLVAAFVAPLGLMFVGSLYADGELSLANYRTVLFDSRSLQATTNTIRYAIWVTLGCMLIGVPTAMAMTRCSKRIQMLTLIGLLLPMSSSVVVKAFGWMILFRREGLINQTLLWLNLVSEPIAFLFTEKGLVLATISLMLPFMVLPVFAVLKQIPGQLDDAATTLGARWSYRFSRVTIPLALPGISVGAALVFSHTVAAYLIPTLLGGSRQGTLSMSIVDSYLAFHDASLGSAYSVLLLALVGMALWSSGRLARARTA